MGVEQPVLLKEQLPLVKNKVSKKQSKLRETIGFSLTHLSAIALKGADVLKSQQEDGYYFWGFEQEQNL